MKVNQLFVNYCCFAKYGLIESELILNKKVYKY